MIICMEVDKHRICAVKENQYIHLIGSRKLEGKKFYPDPLMKHFFADFLGWR